MSTGIGYDLNHGLSQQKNNKIYKIVTDAYADFEGDSEALTGQAVFFPRLLKVAEDSHKEDEEPEEANGRKWGRADWIVQCS
ncbi:hypothetical protein A7975_29075 [Bacillus sp. FJAT-26390]|nr:hypothetical protein A7975_29075 [Bacillus sp. FJAT-26390]